MSKHFMPNLSWANCCQLSGGDSSRVSVLLFPDPSFRFFCFQKFHSACWPDTNKNSSDACSQQRCCKAAVIWAQKGCYRISSWKKKNLKKLGLGFWWLLWKITKLCIHHYLEVDLGVRSTSMQNLPKRGRRVNPLVIFPITCFNNTQVWTGPSSFILDWEGSRASLSSQFEE